VLVIRKRGPLVPSEVLEVLTGAGFIVWGTRPIETVRRCLEREAGGVYNRTPASSARLITPMPICLAHSMRERVSGGQCSSQRWSKTPLTQNYDFAMSADEANPFHLLPVRPPLSPMLAKQEPLPVGGGWIYEPKWDGFRSIVFRSGNEIMLGSRNEKPLTRYFPEVVSALMDTLPLGCVVDSEIVVVGSDGVLDFDALQQRIHPAASRVNKLSAETPASIVLFDVLAVGDEDLRQVPFAQRRERLRSLLVGAHPSVMITPATEDAEIAARWFNEFEGAGCDGLIAKRVEQTYLPDKRVMIKVKHQRTADCVVAGFRWHKNSTADKPMVGSLLLGIYNAEGHLNHVGVTASFTEKRRRELVEELQPYDASNTLADHPWGHWIAAEQAAAAAGQRLPGAQSRWTGEKDLSFVPLRPELVCEVKYAHMQGDRIRHSATFGRWRPDRTPTSCTYEQIEVAVPSTFDAVMASKQ
jgi:ATP-dependent DNA ligase